MERYSKGFIPTSGTFSEGTSHVPMIPADDEKKPIIFGEALILDFRDHFYTKIEADARFIDNDEMAAERATREAAEQLLSDLIYQIADTLVPKTRTINGYALDANIVLNADDINDATTIHKFVTEQEKTIWNEKQDAITIDNKLNSDLVDDTSAVHKFVSVEDIATWNGKQDAITSNNKLNADLVDDNNTLHKFVSAADIANWNNKADLDANGKVPAAQLPSYVDDVVEYPDYQSFPVTGESGKIYIDLDTNKTYRWSGSTYTEISESLALGETASTAYAGDKGKANADAIAALIIRVDGHDTTLGSINDTLIGINTALNNRPTYTEVEGYGYQTANDVSGLITQALIGYATESYVDTQITNALVGYATETWVNSAIVSALNGYATESYVNNLLADYVTSNDLNTLLSDYITSSNLTTILSDYVTVSNLTTTLDDYVTLDSFNLITQGLWAEFDSVNLAINGLQLDIEAIQDSYVSNQTLTNALSQKQDLITAQAKISSSYVDDSNSSNKFVTATEKQTWNEKQDAYFTVGEAAYSLMMRNGGTPQYYNKVDTNFSIAFGVSNIITRDQEDLENGDNPRAAFAAGSGNTIKGLHGFAANAANLVTGDDAASIGKYNTAAGERAFSQGASTEANGNYSHSEGNKTRARAESTHTEGSYTQAEALGGHAEGYGCIVGPGAEVLIDWPFNPNQNPGYAGHAEGYRTQVLGLIGHSEGFFTIAKALASHSEGGYGIASGDYAHVQGLGTQTTENGVIISTHEARGEASFVGGEHSKAIGLATTALGLHLWAKNTGEFATGKWNIDDNDANRLFSIGNGTDEQNRHNAFEVGGAVGQEYLKLGDVQLTKVLLAHLADIDTLLANKQDVIGASTQISADFVDDTNTNHKFVSATEKSTWGGKQDAITPNAKLSADLVDDANSNNKFVTTSEKTAWNNKQDVLTFDSAPTANSDNPVKSSGIKTALDTLSDSVYSKNEASALFAAKEDVTRVSLDQTDIIEIDSDVKMLEFADRVNSGTTFEGKIVRLTADVNLNTNIGNTSSYPFMGCFDGQGHTVTINQTYVNPDGIGGLFSFVRTPASGSVYIKDVRVTGRINVSNTNASCGYFGGLISCVDGNTSGTGGTINISNVQNSVYINCGQSNLWTGVGGMIGFVRHADGLKPLTLNFESCLWDGVINAGPAAYNFGGYVGYTGNNKIGRTLNINIRNCASSGKIAINQDWNQTAGTLIGYAKGNYSDDATAKITINIINIVSNSYMTFQAGTPGSGSAIGHIGEINGTTELNVTNLYYKAFSRGALGSVAPILGAGTATSVTNAVVKTDTEFAALVYDSFPSSSSWDADKWTLLPNVYYPCPRRIFAQFGPPSALYIS